MTIQLLPSQQVNKVKWDQLVTRLPHAPVYARYNYLNLLCDHWSALILNDYNAILPLPWRQKWGIRYYYRPAFIQQLGLIGQCSATDWPNIIHAIKRFAAAGDLCFNHANRAVQEWLPLKAKSNLIIHLNGSIEQIRAQYRSSFNNSLQKAQQSVLEYHASTDISSVIQLYQALYGQRMPHILPSHYQQFQQLCESMQQEQQCLVRTVTPHGKTEILAAILLLKNGNRLFNLCNAIPEQGRLTAANHWLFDQVLNEFSASELILDLEGSEIPGVRNFYIHMGAIEEPYYLYHRNQLVHAWQQLRK